MKLCKDCKHYENPDMDFCNKKFPDPIDGRSYDMDATDTRSREWACGAEAKGFEAKEKPFPEPGSKIEIPNSGKFIVHSIAQHPGYRRDGIAFGPDTITISLVREDK